MKTGKSLILAGLCFLAVSCSKEITSIETVPSGHLSLSVGTIEKTVLTSALKVNWVNTDTLFVFDDNNTPVKFSTTDNNKASAVFTTEKWTGRTPVYASSSSLVFADAACSEGVLTVRINPEQKVTSANSYGNWSSASVGKVTGSEGSYAIESMKNVMGLVRLTILDTSVVSINVKALGGEAVAGTVNVDYEKLVAGDKVFWTPVDGKTSDELNVIPGGVKIKSRDHFLPTSLCVALLPQTYSMGLQFTVYGKGNEVLMVRKVGSSGLTIARNEVSTIIEAVDVALPDEVVIDLDFETGWPLSPACAGNAADRTSTGETYTYSYSWISGGVEKSIGFPVVICQGTSDGAAYYYTASTGNYKTGNIIMMSKVGSWFKLPSIVGRKLYSVTFAHTNGGARQALIKKTYPGDTVFSTTSGAATTSAPYSQTIDNSGNGISSVAGEQFYISFNSSSGTQVNRIKLVYRK